MNYAARAAVAPIIDAACLEKTGLKAGTLYLSYEEGVSTFLFRRWLFKTAGVLSMQCLSVIISCRCVSRSISTGLFIATF